MNYKLSLKPAIITTLVFIYTSFSYSQVNLPDGKNTVLKDKFVKKELKPYAYSPLNMKFWNNIEDLLDAKKYKELLSTALEQMTGYGEDSPEGQEAILALATGLKELNFPTAAYYLLKNLTVSRNGTPVGEHSLMLINELAQQNLVHHEELESLINSNQFGILHPDVKSFISYYKAMYNLKHGFSKWSDLEFENVQTNSYWQFKINYFTALGEISRGRLPNAKNMLNRLDQSKNIPLSIQYLVERQIARIKFEEGAIEEAYRIYNKINSNLNLREKGRLELEKAWTQYYLKDYSKALGILKALKAPLFRPSLTPERYILEMIIYKELCLYDAVKHTAKEFERLFKRSFKRIERRKNLKKDRVLFSMMMLNKKYQQKANLIHLIRSEKRRFIKFDLEYEAKEDILSYYAEAQKRIMKTIDYTVEKDIRELAKELLDVQEQVKFIKYISQLDALRFIEQKNDRDYIPEKISYLKFDKIYWELKNEYWLDEIDSYKMLIKSQCLSKNKREQKQDQEFK